MRFTDHLTSTDHTQRFNLGSARSSGRAEATGSQRAIASDGTKRRSEHICNRRNHPGLRSKKKEKIATSRIDLHVLVRPTRVSPTSSAIFGSGRRSQFLRIAEANASETRCPIRVTVRFKWSIFKNPSHHGAGVDLRGP
jgi:hypothetical protein